MIFDAHVTEAETSVLEKLPNQGVATDSINGQQHVDRFNISGMLPRQIENIGGSIGIYLEKYRSLIGKSTQNIGVYRRSFYMYFTRTSHNFVER